jgi:hypothetical protein
MLPAQVRQGNDMDGHRFDRFAVDWSRGASRRQVIAGLGAAALAAVGVRAASAQETLQRCGGFIGSGCPVGMVCVDDPGDTCSPWSGGADCPGICVAQQENPCISMLCEAGTTCCPRNGGFCIPAGAECDEGLVETPEEDPVMCGSNTCGAGEYCCNASCGVCKPIGEGCTREFCLSGPVASGEPCGPTTCAAGEVCCNESCGICTPPDGFCTQQFCG